MVALVPVASSVAIVNSRWIANKSKKPHSLLMRFFFACHLANVFPAIKKGMIIHAFFFFISNQLRCSKAI
jgi:hypothetical protein